MESLAVLAILIVALIGSNLLSQRFYPTLRTDDVGRRGTYFLVNIAILVIICALAIAVLAIAS